MSDDPRAALDRLIAALEAHLVAVQQRRGEQDPAVEHAYSVLSDAFETYDESLFDSYGETTPFELFDDEDDEDLDEDEDEEDDEDDDLDDDDEDEEDDDDVDLDESDIDESDLGPDDDEDEIDVEDDDPNPATRL